MYFRPLLPKLLSFVWARIVCSLSDSSVGNTVTGISAYSSRQAPRGTSTAPPQQGLQLWAAPAPYASDRQTDSPQTRHSLRPLMTYRRPLTKVEFPTFKLPYRFMAAPEVSRTQQTMSFTFLFPCRQRPPAPLKCSRTPQTLCLKKRPSKYILKAHCPTTPVQYHISIKFYDS